MTLKWQDTVEKRCPCCNAIYVVTVDKMQLALDIIEQDRKSKTVGCGGIDSQLEAHPEVGEEESG